MPMHPSLPTGLMNKKLDELIKNESAGSSVVLVRRETHKNELRVITNKNELAS